MSSRSSRRRRLALAIGLLAPLALLAAAELALRLSGATFAVPTLRYRFVNQLDVDAHAEENVLRPSAELFWELEPGAVTPHGDRIGPHGLRGERPSEERPPLRIALLGDSCVYGVRVPFERTWGEHLRRRIAEARPLLAPAIVNGGVPGYSLHQSRLLYDQRIRPLRPDVLVVYVGAWNDYNPAMGWSDAELARGRDRRGPAHAVAGAVGELRVVQWLKERYGTAVRYHHRKAVIEEWLAREPSSGYRVSLDEFRAHLDAVLDACAEDGTRAVVLLPDLDPARVRELGHRRNRERLDRYRAVLREAAERRRLQSIDLRPLLAPEQGEPPPFLDIVHPDEGGHARIGEAVAEAILGEE